MWKYGVGSKPPSPPSKKLKSTEEKKQKRSEYEQKKRKRKVQEEWLTKYKWLTVEKRFSDEETMFCDVCKTMEPNGSGTFITGCQNIRLEAIKFHNVSIGHAVNVNKYNASRDDSNRSVTEAQECLLQLNKNVIDRMHVLFRTAHALSKHGRPYTDFVWILNLIDSLGINVVKTYRNDKRAREFVTAIAETKMLEIKKEFDSCKYFSIISDGATDSSHCEAELCYVKYAINGEIHTHFVGIKNVGKADAQNISKAIITLLDDTFDNWNSKLIGTGTDGASVMMGKKNGVVQKLKRHTERPYIFAMHCSAHRLELAYKNACSSLPLYKKVECFLLNIYLFYRNSPLQRSNLKSAFSVHNKKPLMPLRASGTRWLPHLSKALRNVLDGYAPLVTHLSQLQSESTKEAAAKGKNFLSVLLSKSVVYFLHFLLDVVKCLAQVSLSFQSRSSTVADVYEELQAAKAILTTYAENPGPQLSKIIEQCQNSDTHRFEGNELKGNLQSFDSARSKLVTELIKRLDQRFESDSKMLKATSIARLVSYPSKLSDFPDYGNEEIMVLGTEFREALMANGVEVDELLPTWIRFKTFLYSNFPNVKQTTWKEVNATLSTKSCDSVLDLLDLVLSLPSSSAEAERGFSVMKIIKSDWRSKLIDAHLSHIMTVNLECPDVGEFNPEESVNHWFISGSRKRKPNYMEEDSKTLLNPINPDESVASTSASNVLSVASNRMSELISESLAGQSLTGKDADSDYESDYESDNDISEETAYDTLKNYLPPDVD